MIVFSDVGLGIKYCRANNVYCLEPFKITVENCYCYSLKIRLDVGFQNPKKRL